MLNSAGRRRGPGAGSRPSPRSAGTEAHEQRVGARSGAARGCSGRRAPRHPAPSRPRAARRAARSRSSGRTPRSAARCARAPARARRRARRNLARARLAAPEGVPVEPRPDQLGRAGRREHRADVERRVRGAVQGVDGCRVRRSHVRVPERRVRALVEPAPAVEPPSTRPTSAPDRENRLDEAEPCAIRRLEADERAGRRALARTRRERPAVDR